MTVDDLIRFDGVSRFFGEVLAVNRISLEIEPGFTALVGPNGSGKSTLMNLLTGLLRPTRGLISVLGVSPDEPEDLHDLVGFCPQWDAFPRGMTGKSALEWTLGLHGVPRAEATARSLETLDRVGLADASTKRVAVYSKGMRQRLKLARALLQDPRVLVLDEPLNGLDPVGRHSMLQLLQTRAASGRHVIVSSHVLHELDEASDRVVMMHAGSVVAEGRIRDVRDEIRAEPHRYLIRTDRPHAIASAIFASTATAEIRILDDGAGLLVSTWDRDELLARLPGLFTELKLTPDAIRAADENVAALYGYLIGGHEEGPR
jgi:ABC-2 type transport system ATP-binding protein